MPGFGDIDETSSRLDCCVQEKEIEGLLGNSGRRVVGEASLFIEGGQSVEKGLSIGLLCHHLLYMTVQVGLRREDTVKEDVTETLTVSTIVCFLFRTSLMPDDSGDLLDEKREDAKTRADDQMRDEEAVFSLLFNGMKEKMESSWEEKSCHKQSLQETGQLLSLSFKLPIQSYLHCHWKDESRR